MIAHPLTRGFMVLLGLAALALGLALFLAGDPDESEEVFFAAAVVVIGALNLAAGGFGSRTRTLATTAVTADALLLGFVIYVLAQGNIG